MNMKFVVLTDTHLTANGQTLYGLNPVARLNTAIDTINTHHIDADFVILTGDIAHRGDPESYTIAANCLSKLKLPYTVMIGNHDDREVLLNSSLNSIPDNNGFIQGSINTSQGRMIYLDTNIPGSASGMLCQKRLGWLESELNTLGDERAFLFMHHPPLNIVHSAMDKIGFLSGDELAEVITPFKNSIRHIFFGHIHRTILGGWLGIPYSCMHGTNHQVWPDFLADDGVIAGSQESASYAYVTVSENEFVVNIHDYLSDHFTFDLNDPSGNQLLYENGLENWPRPIKQAI
jgi:Icc protein